MLGLSLVIGCGKSEAPVAADPAPVLPRKPSYIADVRKHPTASAARRERSKPQTPRAAERSDETQHLSAADAKLYEQISTALDENDVNGVLAGCEGVTTNSDVSVRQQAVDALAWFGEDMRALEKLQTFIDDPDEDVAADAFRRMEENTDLIEDETQRNNYLLRAFYRHSDRAEVIDYVCDKLKNADLNEATMKTLVKLTISSNPIAMARARATYKFMTGETYTSCDRAMEWIKENGE